MKVLINDKDGKRKEVEAQLIKETTTTVIVKLPDGNIISRKKKRDVVKESEAK
jgi:hypothetical protein